jgi:Xaa-Pro dipeptidase
LAWNPMTLIAVLKKIDGSATARRVGTDAITPTFAALLPEAFPRAEIVDGELAMRAARRIKTPDEIAAMGPALRIAEAGIATALAELRPGVTEQMLAGTLLEAMAAGGVSTPATQDAAWVTSREHPWRRANRAVREGDLVALAAGALAGGYVGEVGGTWPAGAADGATSELFERSNTLYGKLIGACRAGVSTRELLAAYEAAGELIPPMPIAHGLGLGSIRRSYPRRSRRPANTSASRPAWCWRSPATCGSGASGRSFAVTPSTSPKTAPKCSSPGHHGRDGYWTSRRTCQS